MSPECYTLLNLTVERWSYHCPKVVTLERGEAIVKRWSLYRGGRCTERERAGPCRERSLWRENHCRELMVNVYNEEVIVQR